MLCDMCDLRCAALCPAGTPDSNQALLFAGRQLGPDAALLLDELQLDSYSLAHEVSNCRRCIVQLHHACLNHACTSSDIIQRCSNSNSNSRLQGPFCGVFQRHM